MPKSKKRYTIGLLLNGVYGTYQQVNWTALHEDAVRNDYNLVMLAGFYPRSNYSYEEDDHTVIRNLIKNRHLDGLILLTGSLWKKQGIIEGARALKADLPGIPMVSLAIKLPDIPSILLDNYSGMKEAINHLILHHNKKRIAFIRGPDHNEANQRYKAYLDALSENGLPFNEKLIVMGNYESSSGIRAAKELVENRKIKFDALASANDDMAYYAMKYLKGREFNIPRDILITGFDDADNAAFTLPPLTTVRQPIETMASKAAGFVLSMLHGEKNPGDLILRPELVIRQSCGCLPSELKILEKVEFPSSDYSKVNDSMPAAFQKEYSAVIKKFLQNLELPRAIIQETSVLFHKIPSLVLKPEEIGAFLIDLNYIMMDIINQSYKLLDWREIIYEMKNLSGSIRSDPGLQMRWLDLVNRLEVLFLYQDKIEQNRNNQKYYYEMWMLPEVIQRIPISFNKDILLENIETAFIKTGFQRFFISVRKNNVDEFYYTPEINSKLSELILAVDKEKGRFEKEFDGKLFPQEEVIPESAWPKSDRFSFFIMPLVTPDTHYGFVVYQIGPLEGFFYEMLSFQISSALKSSYLFHERALAEEKLNKALKELEEERNILKQRNDRIEKDLQTARRIQLSLIPSKSPWKGIAYIYKAMEKVGGDFFDFITFPNDESYGIFMSDVSGHGVGAAFITALIKAFLADIAPQTRDPSKTLSTLNKKLLNQTDGNFVTAIYGIFTPSNREFIWASAGHTRPILISKGKVQLLSGKNNGLPLSVLSNRELSSSGRSYALNTTVLPPDSRLLIYTDGLIEAIPAKSNADKPENDFENSRLYEVLSGLGNLGSKELISQLFQSLVDFRGNNQFDDDICIVCVDTSS